MKKLKGIFIIIFVFLLSILNLNSKAYSTNDFYIDIPDYYEKSDYNTFIYSSSSNVRYINIRKEYIENTNSVKYKQKRFRGNN